MIQQQKIKWWLATRENMDQRTIRKSLGAVQQKELHSSTAGLPDVMRFFSTVSHVEIPSSQDKVERWLGVPTSSIVEIPSPKVDKSEVFLQRVLGSPSSNLLPDKVLRVRNPPRRTLDTTDEKMRYRMGARPRICWEKADPARPTFQKSTSPPQRQTLLTGYDG